MLYSVFILCLNVVTHLSKKRLKSFNDDVEAVVVFTKSCRSKEKQLYSY